MERRWIEEQLFFDGDAFFDALAARISAAQRSIELEMYIFEYDELGKRFAELLLAAAARGVRVRVIVDSVGSLNSKAELFAVFAGSCVDFDVYHELPWERVPARDERRRSRLGAVLRQINRRNHRKVAIIDREQAWLGGMNLWGVHLRSLKGDEAWRDSGIAVRGEEVAHLLRAFERVWSRKRLHRLRWSFALPEHGALVRLNYTRRLRRKNFRDLLRRIRLAEKRIWITTPYFVPPRQLRRALRSAASRGIDVRILLPQQSDIAFLPWVSWVLYLPLLQSGARVFRYLPAVLHAKTIIIDQWMTLGSSNLNHRSFIHDLEVDVVVTHESSRTLLVEQYVHDLEQSREVLGAQQPLLNWWQRLLGRVAFYFHYWL